MTRAYIVVGFLDEESARVALERDVPYIGHVITEAQAPQLPGIHLKAVERAHKVGAGE